MAGAEYYAVVTGVADGLDASQCLDGFQGSQSDPVEMSGKDEASGVEISVAARPDLSGRVRMRRVPGEHNLADHLMKAKSWHEIEKMIRGVPGRREVRQGHQRNQPGMKGTIWNSNVSTRGAHRRADGAGSSIRAAVAQTTAAAEEQKERQRRRFGEPRW